VLYADVLEDKSFLITKLKITLNDCKEKVVYETAFGVSRDKDYNIAYNMALREASKSFDQLHYSYNGKNEMAVEIDISEKLAGKVYSIDVTESKPTSSSNITDTAEIFFFAQPIANGFQVVNSEPKVIMFTTSQKNVFIGQKDTIQGVVLFKNDQWFFEYYENEKLVSELLKLKF
jgi:hypothetical protein